MARNRAQGRPPRPRLMAADTGVELQCGMGYNELQACHSLIGDRRAPWISSCRRNASERHSSAAWRASTVWVCASANAVSRSPTSRT